MGAATFTCFCRFEFAVIELDNDQERYLNSWKRTHVYRGPKEFNIQHRLCVAESTGKASVAIYNLDFVSNKNALGDWELKSIRSKTSREHDTESDKDTAKFSSGK